MTEELDAHCFSWIKERDNGNATTLQDLNDLFAQWNLGGSIFISIMMVTGFLGNITVIWIYASKFKYTNFRTYTLWLASIDVTNCCLGMPFLLVYHRHYLTFPTAFICKLGRFILVFTANASAFLLVVIGVDRYIHMCQPCRFRVNKRVRRMLPILAVVLALGISWPALVIFGNHTVNALPYKITGNRCWEDDSVAGNNYVSDFYFVQAVISFVITVVLFILYSLVVRYIYRNKITDRSRHTKKTTFILLAVTVAYGLSALPHNIAFVVAFKKPLLHCRMTFTEGFMVNTFLWSILINNSVNPFIYGFSDTKFREKLKQTFKICFPETIHKQTS